MKKTVRKILYLFLILLSVCLFSACSLPKIEIPGGGGGSDGKVTVRVLHYVQDEGYRSRSSLRAGCGNGGLRRKRKIQPGNGERL